MRVRSFAEDDATRDGGREWVASVDVDDDDDDRARGGGGAKRRGGGGGGERRARGARDRALRTTLGGDARDEGGGGGGEKGGDVRVRNVRGLRAGSEGREDERVDDGGGVEIEATHGVRIVRGRVDEDSVREDDARAGHRRCERIRRVHGR